jgi:hypothetical protein
VRRDIAFGAQHGPVRNRAAGTGLEAARFVAWIPPAWSVPLLSCPADSAGGLPLRALSPCGPGC